MTKLEKGYTGWTTVRMPSVAGVAIDSDMGGPANNYQKRGVGLITAGQLVSQYKDLAK